MDPSLEREQLPDAPALLRPGRRRAGHDRPGVAPRPRSPGGGSRWTSSRSGRGHRGLPQLRSQGQAGDLPVPVGRTVADGPVRSQAGARSTARDRAARLDPDGAAADGHDLAAGPLPGRGEPVPVRAARPERRDAQRAAAVHGERGRRALLHQVDAHRGDQPRPGRHLFPDRRPARGPAQHRRLGRRTAWGARTRTCRPSWS